MPFTPRLRPGLSALTPDHRLYINPIDLHDGACATASIADGEALRLAGGAIAFSRVELVWRRIGEPPERLVTSVANLWNLIAGADPTVAERVSTLVSGLSRVRPVFAGMSLDSPRIMAVVNVTPDSFSDGGRYKETRSAIEYGQRLWGEGADIVDVGGVSTRPGADPVSIQEELDRVLPVVEGLRDLPVPISIDTRSAAVMRQAVAAGAAIINDTSAMSHDDGSLNAAHELGVPIVLMHCLGDPKTMQAAPRYVNAPCDVYDYLEARLDACRAHGIDGDRIVVDPGIGFGKTVAHNVEILSRLAMLHGLGAGLLIGASRKSFIEHLSPGTPSDHRMPGSLAAALWALRSGAQLVRVHDVAETKQAALVWGAMAAYQSA